MRGGGFFFFVNVNKLKDHDEGRNVYVLQGGIYLGRKLVVLMGW